MAITEEQRCTYCDNPAQPAVEAVLVCLHHCAGNLPGGPHIPDWSSASSHDVEVEPLQGNLLRVHVAVTCQGCPHFAYVTLVTADIKPGSLEWNPA